MSGLPLKNIHFAQGFPARQSTTGLKPSPNQGSRPRPSYSFESGDWNSRLSPLFPNPGSCVPCRDFTTNRWLRCGKFRSLDPLNSAALYLAQWWYSQELPVRFCEKNLSLPSRGSNPGPQILPLANTFATSATEGTFRPHITFCRYHFCAWLGRVHV